MPNTERKPDFTTEMALYGVTYEICAYFEGKQTLTEIIAKRVIHEMNKEVTAPSIKDPEGAHNSACFEFLM